MLTDIDIGELSFGALVDRMKYLIRQDVIPEGVLMAVAYVVLKDLARSKGLELVLNYLVHGGGIAKLERDLSQNQEVLEAIDRCIEIWEKGIPLEMIRIPDGRGERS